MSQCKEITGKGTRCTFSAKEGEDYCGIHLSNNMGRPKELEDIDLELLTKLCKLGLTDAQLAEFYEVAEATIYNAKNRDKDFLEAIKRGKRIADAEVGEALFQRATGYSHEDVKIMNVDGSIRQVPYVNHYAPDTTAAIFWLKNRQPENWRDTKNIDLESQGQQIKGIVFDVQQGKDPAEIYGEQEESDG